MATFDSVYSELDNTDLGKIIDPGLLKHLDKVVKESSSTSNAVTHTQKQKRSCKRCMPVKIELLKSDNKCLRQEVIDLKKQLERSKIKIEQDYQIKENLGQTIDLHNIQFQMQLSEKDKSFDNEKKTLETVFMTNCVRNNSLHKLVLIKHIQKCKTMITNLSQLLPFLQNGSIPTFTECRHHIELWKIELERSQKCLNAFEEFEEKILAIFQRRDFTTFPEMPEFSLKTDEPRNIIQDSFYPAISKLLGELQHYTWSTQNSAQEGVLSSNLQNSCHADHSAPYPQILPMATPIGKPYLPSSNFDTNADVKLEIKDDSPKFLDSTQATNQSMAPSTKTEVCKNKLVISNNVLDRNIELHTESSHFDYNSLSPIKSSPTKCELDKQTETIKNHTFNNTLQHKNQKQTTAFDPAAKRRSLTKNREEEEKLLTCTNFSKPIHDPVALKNDDGRSEWSAEMKFCGGPKFYNLFYYIKSKISNKSESEVWKALIAVKQKRMKLTGMTKDKIVDAVQEELYSLGNYVRESNKTSPLTNTNAALNSNNKEQDISCTVCLDSFESMPVTSLKCGHKFHLQCIRKWLVTNCACPVCRIHITTNTDEDYFC